MRRNDTGHTTTPPVPHPNLVPTELGNDTLDTHPADYAGTFTVAMVAQRIGVSPSTIRTWERRYGLAGSTPRGAGEHRRYSREDVEVLNRMAQLVKSGIRASEAAKELSKRRHCTAPPQPSLEETAAELVQAARKCNMLHMESLLIHAIRTRGLIPTWTNLISPALHTLHTTHCACNPGSDSTLFLKTAAFSALRTTSNTNTHNTTPGSHILIITNEEHQLAAHFCGAELANDAHPVSVIDADNFLGTNLPGVDLTRVIGIVVLVGANERPRILEHAMRLTTAMIINVAPDMFGILHHRIQRVRTLTACIEELRAVCQQGQRYKPQNVKDHTWPPKT